MARSDGFEKRWLQRCGRCKSTIGYQIDHEQYGQSGPRNIGRREDVLYVLTGGLQTTSEMKDAKDE